MNKNVTNKTKKFIIMLAVIMLCNFVVPNYTFASSEINLGIFFKPIAQFILHVSDLIMQGLQAIAVGDGTIQVKESPYYIRFSPGAIFSGEIPMFDINFINPQEDFKVVRLMAVSSEEMFNGSQLGVTEKVDVEQDWTSSELYKKNGIIYNFITTGVLKSTSRNRITKNRAI